MTGAGTIIGPVIGSALYSFLGFRYTFFVYGALEIILGIYIRINLPERKIHQSKQVDEFTAETLLEARIGSVRNSEVNSCRQVTGRSSYLNFGQLDAENQVSFISAGQMIENTT